VIKFWGEPEECKEGVQIFEGGEAKITKALQYFKEKIPIKGVN